MDGERVKLPQHLSEVEAHQLLTRAAELDARLGTSVTIEQLSAAAVEAGMSAEALEQAAAELAAGKLGSPARGAAIRRGIVAGGRVAIAAVLVWWLIVDATRPVAQGLALAFAVYGAYKALGWLLPRLSQRLKAAGSLKPAPPLENSPGSTEDHTVLSVRLLTALTACRSAA